MFTSTPRTPGNPAANSSAATTSAAYALADAAEVEVTPAGSRTAPTSRVEVDAVTPGTRDGWCHSPASSPSCVHHGEVAVVAGGLERGAGPWGRSGPRWIATHRRRARSA